MNRKSNQTNGLTIKALVLALGTLSGASLCASPSASFYSSSDSSPLSDSESDGFWFDFKSLEDSIRKPAMVSEGLPLPDTLVTKGRTDSLSPKVVLEESTRVLKNFPVVPYSKEVNSQIVPVRPKVAMKGPKIASQNSTKVLPRPTVAGKSPQMAPKKQEDYRLFMQRMAKKVSNDWEYLSSQKQSELFLYLSEAEWQRRYEDLDPAGKSKNFRFLPEGNRLTQYGDLDSDGKVQNFKFLSISERLAVWSSLSIEEKIRCFKSLSKTERLDLWDQLDSRDQSALFKFLPESEREQRWCSLDPAGRSANFWLLPASAQRYLWDYLDDKGKYWNEAYCPAEERGNFEWIFGNRKYQNGSMQEYYDYNEGDPESYFSYRDEALRLRNEDLSNQRR